jgi:broad specificity phosphatase PhoE
MPSILLIRHGQASFGGENYDVLSPLGEAQAGVVADEFGARDPRPDTVVSGSLARQRDTATPVAEALGLELGVDPRWDEYDMDRILARHSDSPIRTTSHGAHGQPTVSSRAFQDLLEQALSSWIEAGSRGGTALAGSDGSAETWPEFAARTRAALGELAGSLASGETALVFTSGGVLAAICAGLLGLGPRGFLALNRVAVNAAITRIAHGRSGTTLISFNEHGHLERRDRGLVTYR